MGSRFSQPCGRRAWAKVGPLRHLRHRWDGIFKKASLPATKRSFVRGGRGMLRGLWRWALGCQHLDVRKAFSGIGDLGYSNCMPSQSGDCYSASGSEVAIPREPGLY